MKPCPHKRVKARIWSRRGQCWIRFGNRDGRSVDYDALICRDCGEWLGLGEAKDEGEAVRIEIRAASIASDWDKFINGDWQAFVSLGATSPEGEHIAILEKSTADMPQSTLNRQDLSDYMVGWLACAIATHSEPQ